MVTEILKASIHKTFVEKKGQGFCMKDLIYVIKLFLLWKSLTLNPNNAKYIIS